MFSVAIIGSLGFSYVSNFLLFPIRSLLGGFIPSQHLAMFPVFSDSMTCPPPQVLQSKPQTHFNSSLSLSSSVKLVGKTYWFFLSSLLILFLFMYSFLYLLCKVLHMLGGKGDIYKNLIDFISKTSLIHLILFISTPSFYFTYFHFYISYRSHQFQIYFSFQFTIADLFTFHDFLISSSKYLVSLRKNSPQHHLVYNALHIWSNLYPNLEGNFPLYWPF